MILGSLGKAKFNKANRGAEESRSDLKLSSKSEGIYFNYSDYIWNKSLSDYAHMKLMCCR